MPFEMRTTHTKGIEILRHLNLLPLICAATTVFHDRNFFTGEIA